MSELLIYTANEKNVTVRLEGETVWLSQKQMADLLETSTDNIGLHLKNIYSQEELEESATTEDFSVVQTEGARQVSRRVMHYNLDAIISVGYRVNSRRGVQFRQWATRVLREHLVQGYTFNPARLAEKGMAEAQQAIELLARTLENQALVSATGRYGHDHQRKRAHGPGPAGGRKPAHQQGSDDPPRRQSAGFQRTEYLKGVNHHV